MPDGKVGVFDLVLLRTVCVCVITMSLQITDFLKDSLLEGGRHVFLPFSVVFL